MWAARRTIQAGKSVIVLEKRQLGAGASGGFLGALMPHMPDRWNAKKQFQFEALSTIGEAIETLEADTGMECGFRRCGRLIPVRNEQTLADVQRRIDGARQNWPGHTMKLLEPPLAQSLAGGWLAEANAPFGAVHDKLSARVNPRAYLAALGAFVREHGELREGIEVASLDPERRRVALADGTVIEAGEIIIAAGWEAYALLAPLMSEMIEKDGPYANGLPGRGVKGQAMLLEHGHSDERHILYDNGAYVVPHAGNRVAVGSTAEENWQDGPAPERDEFDPANTDFHRRALELAPSLRNAPIIERWANVRPRNMLKGRGTEPFMGRVPGYDNLTALIGGFRIGLAVAHMALVE